MDDVFEFAVEVLGPLVGDSLLELDLDNDGIADFWIWPTVAQMHIIFSESGSALSPPSGKRDADRFQYRRLSGVVGSYKDCNRAKLNVCLFDRAKV